MRTPVRLAAVVGTVAACAAALTGCGSSPSSTPPPPSSGSAAVPAASATATTFPMTVTVDNRTVTIKARPTRIVSLSPTATEDLYKVGAGSQVVAVDQDSDYPAGVPRTSLSGRTPNIEAIAKYNPSLVIAQEDPDGMAAKLAKLGIPVLIEPQVATLGEVYAQIQQIGQVTGHAAKAASVTAGMKQQILTAVEGAGDHPGMTYYWELSANPLSSATSSTFSAATSSTLIGQIVGLFGLTNIADKAPKASDGGDLKLSQEYIVTANPQIIFLADNQAADVVEHRSGWSGITAVQNHEVFRLNDNFAANWGTDLPQLVTEIANAVKSAATAHPSQSPTP